MAAYYVEMTLRARAEDCDLTPLFEPLRDNVATLARATDITVGMNIAHRTILLTMHLEADTESEAVIDSLAAARAAVSESSRHVESWGDPVETDCLFLSLMRTVM